MSKKYENMSDALKFRLLAKRIGPFINSSPEELLMSAIEMEAIKNSLSPFDMARYHFVQKQSDLEEAAVIRERNPDLIAEDF
jgi:hypothetical protein